MEALTMLCLLTGYTASPSQHPPGFPYPQLPTEVVCELCYHQCERDRAALTARAQVSCGWRREELLDLKREADRLTAIYYAAWWVTWSKSQPVDVIHCMPSGPPVIVEFHHQRDEWAATLISLIDEDSFWRGDLPLPLGCYMDTQ